MPTLRHHRLGKRFPADQTPERDIFFLILLFRWSFVSPRRGVDGELVHLPAG